MLHSTVAALASWLLLAGNLASAADRPFIGNWALTLPGGYPGWLAITRETNYLDGAMLWHVTVVLNGKKIINNQPLQGITGGALTADEFKPGPIYFQGDHTGVDYRNIVLRPVAK